MRLTVDEYSHHFKMSKEMINSKLRSKKLNYIIEDGVTYIIVLKSSLEEQKHTQIDEAQKESSKEQQTQTKALAKPKTTVAMVLNLYQRENQQLKEKIAQLEQKIDKLIDDKEQMLRDEMSKIEQVYNEKDIQLKNILELLNAKFLAEKSQTIHEAEPLVHAKQFPHKEEMVELKSYLKSLELEPYQRKIIKKRFLAVYDEDIRLIKQNGNIFLNFSKYDYSDLLEY
jgi:predicted RNase H-like nuclease (RuvC/YqgF family)